MSSPYRHTERESVDSDVIEALLSLSKTPINHQPLKSQTKESYQSNSISIPHISDKSVQSQIPRNDMPKTPRFYNQTNDNKENINPNIKLDSKSGNCSSPFITGTPTPTRSISKRDSSVRNPQKHSFVSRVKNVNSYISSPTSPYSTGPKRVVYEVCSSRFRKFQILISIQRPRYSFDELVKLMVPKDPTRPDTNSYVIKRFN